MLKLLTLAVRNLVRNIRRTFLTISAIGFGLGMMIWMIVIATGQYHDLLKQGISTIAGHVVIEHVDYSDEGEPNLTVDHAEALKRAISAQLPNAIIAPRIQMAGLLTSPANNLGVLLRGVDPVAEARVVDLDGQIVDGTWLNDTDERGILIGVALAERLGVEVGEKLVFMGQMPGEDVESRLFRVRGIFRTGSSELDSFIAIATIPSLQQVMKRPDSVHQLTIHLTDPRQTDQARTLIAGLLPSDTIEALTWKEALPDLVAFIAMDRVSSDVMMAVLGLIVMMGVLNTVLMSVLERTREFGVLMAIGMRPTRMASLVVLEGLVLGLIGTFAGLIFGGFLGGLMVRYGLDYSSMMGGETMEMEGVVVSTHLMGAWDLTRIAKYSLLSVLATVGSSLYPAWHLYCLKPVDAMRHS